MPVTKTAKRALRGSKNKTAVNKKITTNLEIAMRMAKRSKKTVDILKVISLADRASKKKVIHKNKAARIKSAFSKLLPRVTPKTPKRIKKTKKK
jgi:ribosomal protein S20